MKLIQLSIKKTAVQLIILTNCPRSLSTRFCNILELYQTRCQLPFLSAWSLHVLPVCVSSLWVLWLLPPVQRHGVWLTGNPKMRVNVKMLLWSLVGLQKSVNVNLPIHILAHSSKGEVWQPLHFVALPSGILTDQNNNLKITLRKKQSISI